MPAFLSKSDFKACFDCATKLYYRKNRYPSTKDEDPYLQFLADSGFMVEYVAKAQFPLGVDLVEQREPEASFEQTCTLIHAAEDAVVFEAAALHGRYYARIDILRREGNRLHLIEVKSASLHDEDSSPFLGLHGRIASKWKPYLLDVAFQAMVLRRSFPSFKVVPWLWVVNKDHRVTEAETMGRFGLTRPDDSQRGRPEVVYHGNRAGLMNTPLLSRRNVTTEVDMLMDEVEQRAAELAGLIGEHGAIEQTVPDLGQLYRECSKCEYRFSGPQRPQPHGFAECWGDLAEAPHHVLDLHRVGQIESTNFPDPIPDLLWQGRASLLDIQENQLGVEGARRARRLIQWRHSQNNTEYLADALREELRSHELSPGWPLHFLDFEACDVALPHHPGLRPYERVAFQWSCHTVTHGGGYAHAEWLNTQREFPNFKFAKTLREQLGKNGTVYVWSPYEQGTLAKVLEQIANWSAIAPDEALRVSGMNNLNDLRELAAWIDDLLGLKDEDGKRIGSPRIRDLHRLACNHYFHPAMLGRTSIKVVLPAVWNHSVRLRNDPWFAEYLQTDEQGAPKDPYHTLPALPLGEDDDGEEAVKEGTGAIRVYQQLIFCGNLSPEIRANHEALLRQYCKLDTAAMVMIWKHWKG